MFRACLKEDSSSHDRHKRQQVHLARPEAFLPGIHKHETPLKEILPTSKGQSEKGISQAWDQREEKYKIPFKNLSGSEPNFLCE